MTLPRSDLLQGTLDMLILRVLQSEAKHGYAIAERILQLSAEVFEVNQGSLYPALQRLLRAGWVRAEWRRTESNRRARYYGLTPAGRNQLEREMKSWERTSEAVNRILSPAAEG
jgi:PadR family transcriptional regulator PadR